MANKQDEFPTNSISVDTGCGKMYVHLLFTDQAKTKFHRILATLGKSGGCARSHLESKVAMINALIHNAPNNIAIKTLTDASGHKCHVENTCHDILIRIAIAELMKVKI